MKKVLSLLLAFVFLQVETYALSGGPVFGVGGGAGPLNVIGTYGGVLLPSNVIEEGNQLQGAQPASTSIGLFSFAVNEAGPAVGGAVVFIKGAAYNGTITGIADPLDGAFRAVVDAISTYVITQLIPTGQIDANGNPTFTTADFNVFATGSIEATITSPTNGVAVDPLTGLNSGTTRVDGLATLDISFEVNPDGTPVISSSVAYTVSGFKQSDTATAATFAVGTNNPSGGNTP